MAEAGEQKSIRAMLDAGRGNPNWIAAAPREAFFALGQFALTESRRVWEQGALAGKPNLTGIYQRWQTFARENAHLAGLDLLRRIIEYGIRTHDFDCDRWVYELVDGIIGDNYPTPDRMLTYVEHVVHDFLMQEICTSNPDAGPFDLFAVEGATAAMCYIFDSLSANHLLMQGDKIAIMVPIFPPYIEIPHLDRYAFDVVEIRASAVDADGSHTWQYPKEELDKLKDNSIRALFLVNPSNPPSVAMDEASVSHLVNIVQKHNPDLMIISDDVYCTFVDSYQSVLAALPTNTIGVYSLSKYFGVTGWRLGVIAVHRDGNIFDDKLRKLPNASIQALNKRYASLSQHPEQLRFMDRLVADSRQVALNHTAGLSTPQQVQMALFVGFALTDKENQYKQLTKDICHRRMRLLYEGLELPLPRIPHDADYYTEFDLGEWACRRYGSDFVKYLQDHYEPVDVLFRLAEQSSIVLLNGSGFHGPLWSVRVSLANLNDDAYAQIGHALRQALESYVGEWRNR